MRNYNRTVLMGHLAQDPEYREPREDVKVADFTVVTNRSRKEGDDEVSYISCSAFGQTAVAINKYFKKGRPMFVEGRLKQERWEKDGKKQSRIKVIVEKFEFLDSKKVYEDNETIPETDGNYPSGSDDQFDAL